MEITIAMELLYQKVIFTFDFFHMHSIFFLYTLRWVLAGLTKSDAAKPPDRYPHIMFGYDNTFYYIDSYQQHTKGNTNNQKRYFLL